MQPEPADDGSGWTDNGQSASTTGRTSTDASVFWFTRGNSRAWVRVVEPASGVSFSKYGGSWDTCFVDVDGTSHTVSQYSYDNYGLWRVDTKIPNPGTTELDFLHVIQAKSSGSSESPVTRLTGAGYIGAYVADATRVAALFSEDGTDQTSCSFSVPGSSGIFKATVANLQANTYSVTQDGESLGSYAVDSDGVLFFSADLSNGQDFVVAQSSSNCPNTQCEPGLGENCQTCSLDCPTASTQVCCSGSLYTGDCCDAGDCSGSQICNSITHLCESPPQCEQDADGDGYGVGASCLGPDCDDSNPNVHEDIICSFNGLVCGTHSLCTLNCPTPPAEVCDNTQDDDCDTQTDCADPDCSSDPICQSQNRYIWIEAESGQRTLPMQIGQDADASNSSYIFTPESTPDTTNPQPEATIDFDIPESGDYMLWARLYGPTGDNDAVYIGFNGNYDRAFPDNAWGVYQWVGIEVTHNSGNYHHNLNGGQNQINMGHGEGGARVDRLLVTNDLTYVPIGSGQHQYHRADADQSCTISQPELLAWVDNWYMDSTAYPMWEMMEAVGFYYSGNAC